MTNFLSKEEIIDINRKVTKLSRDPFGVQNLANLDHLAIAMEYKYNDKDEDQKIVLKASFMLDFIANKGHIFIEGNKRTAITATLTFLEINGFMLSDYDKGTDKRESVLVKFVLEVAKGEHSVSSISRWLNQRILSPNKLNKLW